MTDIQNHQQQLYHQQGDEESFYSDPTPIPNEYRPPPPVFQAAQQPAATKLLSAVGGGYENINHRLQETSLLNSTLLSLSIDDIGTLPSIALNPPSPISEPSPSLLQHPSPTIAKNTGTTLANAKETPSGALSLARSRRKQRQQKLNTSTVSELSQEQQHQHQHQHQHTDDDKRNNPPMNEVYMNDTESDESKDSHLQDYANMAVDDSDTFFECVGDRSLANRALRTMRTNVRSSPNGSMMSSIISSPGRHNNTNERGNYGQQLENIEENIGGDDVVRVHESALNALQQLKEELIKSNQRNEELSKERDTWKEEEAQLKQQAMILQATDRQRDTGLERLQQDHERLRTDKETIERQRNQLVEEKQKLESQSRDSTRTIKEFRHRILAGDNRYKALKGQLDKLNGELEGALSSKGEMAAELARAQTERMDLESKMETFRKKISEATKERDLNNSDGLRVEEELRAERKKLQELRASSNSETGRLNKSLRKANEALHKLRDELTPKVRSAVHQIKNQGGADFDGMQHTSMMTSSSAGTAFGPPPTLDSAIADRLARLRDSAERAHLIRGHKRELSRMKADFTAKIQQLQIDHVDATKKAAKQSDARRKRELEELAQKLHQQHESQLEDAEEEHQKRLSQLLKDHGRSREESDESLEEALSQIARVTQDHGREKGRRHALERTMEELQRKLRKQLKESQAGHSDELEKRKRQWDSEKEMLLGNLQRECNIAFDNRRRGISENNNNNNNNTNWTAALGAPTTAVRGTTLHIDTSETPRSMPTQVQGHGQRPPTASSHNHLHNARIHQQQPRSTGPSPLSMNSAPFFSESKNHSPRLEVVAPQVRGTGNHGVTMGGATYIVPSPRRNHPTSPIEMFTGMGGTGSVGAPSIISKSYSDIDSVLRETEELVQSIL